MAESSLLQCFFVLYLPHRFTLFFEPDEHNLCILHCILNIVIHVHVHSLVVLYIKITVILVILQTYPYQVKYLLH